MKNNVLTLILLFCIAIVIFPVSAVDIKYYAYGDSISTCFGNSNCYIYNIESGAIVDHNLDGDGKTSTWGLRNIETHYNTSQRFFMIMFGRNDEDQNITPLTTAKNLEMMYRYVSANGSTPVILIKPLYDPARYGYGNSTYNNYLVQSYLTAMNIPFVEMYDALDTVPENGIMDTWVDGGNYQLDGVHPTAAGQILMGKYLWNHYFSSFPNKTTCQCQYNDTGYLFARTGFRLFFTSRC
jgi:lysophospholipase L1-like esterase